MPSETNRHSDELLERISVILRRQGIKDMTMDAVAAELGMSKRTLYEIFSSKADMAKQAYDYIQRTLAERGKRLMAEAPNALVGLRLVSYDHVDFIASTDVRFFSDFHDQLANPEAEFASKRREHAQGLLEVCELGVKQGVFRPEVDYPLQVDMIMVQMEALKRVEEICGSQRTLPEMLRLICDSFLRVVATRRGLDMLDALESASPTTNENSNSTQ